MISKRIPAELKKAINESLRAPRGKSMSSLCEHVRKTRDEYSLTCVDCGKVLAGYGLRKESCIHKYLPHLKNKTKDICVYCQKTRPRTYNYD